MKLRPADVNDVIDVEEALKALRDARQWLRNAGCPQAVRKVHSAIKSTEGALRHVNRRFRATQP